MGGLSFTDRARRSMWRVVPKRAVSGAIGWGARRGLPSKLRGLMLARFARAYGIDVSEAETPRGIVSPADGTVVECGFATAGKLIQAKGTLFDLAELLGDAEIAARLV